VSSSLNSAQIARYAARLQGQRLLPLLRGWQIRRAIRRLSLDGGPPALAALKDSADRGLLREERYRSLLEMVLFLEVDQPQAERIRALLWEAPQEEPATKPEDLPPSSPGEAGADPGVSALICDEQVADATPTPAGTLQPLQETRAADTPADAVRRAESGEPLPEAAADLAEEEQVPAPSDDHVQPEVGEEVASEQSGEPDDATEDSEEAPEDALPDEAHTEDDAVEKEPEASDLLATRGDTDDHEVRWDPLDDPDPPWVATLDRHVQLDPEERKLVIAQIAQSDLSIEEWIERLLEHEEDPRPTLEQLTNEQSFEAMLAELWMPGDPFENERPGVPGVAVSQGTSAASPTTTQPLSLDAQVEAPSSTDSLLAGRLEVTQAMTLEEAESAEERPTAAVAPEAVVLPNATAVAEEGVALEAGVTPEIGVAPEVFLQPTRPPVESSSEHSPGPEQERSVSDSPLSQLLLDDWDPERADPIIEELVNCATQLLNSDGTRQAGPYDSLLAGLLTFHLREKLANEQDFAAHLAMNEEALEQDSDCIANATLVSTEPFRRNEHLAIYRYEARQPFRHGGRATRAEQLVCQESGVMLEVHEVMATEGQIKLTVKSETAKALLPLSNLIHRPKDIAAQLRAYLAEQAPVWINDESALPPAVRHLFSRQGSDQIRRLSQQVRETPEQTAELISEVLFEADGLSLILQGPPGTGKTTCAAKVITTLVDAGWNIGVCANSHLAIDNLLFRTAELASRTQQPINLAKYQSSFSKQEREQFNAAGIQAIDSRSFKPSHDVYGGTAFAFSHARFDGLLDLLVIDEASQVSLANLLAMGRSTRNLLLVGDQQQLPQPTVAEHPGESGLSCLGYATAGEPVIPDHKGVFLSRSWRLPPNLCGFISEQFYERRLEAETRNTANRVIWTGQGNGLQFEAVPHQDNHVYSLEEVEAVERLVSQLLGCPYTRQSAEGPISATLTWDDIAIVAPFNAQVNLLQRQLGRQAQVGTVDRFQGREAPVCIYSVTTSRTLSTRGLEFVLDANRVNVAISRAQCLAIVVASPLVGDLLQAAETLQRETLLFQHLSRNPHANPAQP